MSVEISQLLLWTSKLMISFSSLTTVLDNNLPTFRLDPLILLKVNEAKAWGTSIYSYVEASWRASLLIDRRWAYVLSMKITVSHYAIHYILGVHTAQESASCQWFGDSLVENN